MSKSSTAYVLYEKIVASLDLQQPLAPVRNKNECTVIFICFWGNLTFTKQTMVMLNKRLVGFMCSFSRQRQ